MSRSRKLKLAHPIPLVNARANGYEVIEVGNSTDFVPGQVLTKAEVDDLLRGSLYEIVTVRKKDR